jgi:Fur family transcriptional regulator, ferric uptake regulator
MLKEDSREKGNFKSLIEADEIGGVEDGLKLIDVFLKIVGHVTLEDFISLLRAKGFDYDEEFIKLSMNRWVELGFAQKTAFEGQPPRYEHRHLGKHHDHIICTKCGKIFEFQNNELEALQEKIAAEAGYHMLQHKMEIYGLCSQCMADRSDLMPLSSAKTGEEVYIRDFTGGAEVRSRLTSMGFRTGNRLEIINNDGMGKLIVGNGDSRVAIGRGMAEKIIVSLSRQKGGGATSGSHKLGPLWKLFKGI